MKRARLIATASIALTFAAGVITGVMLAPALIRSPSDGLPPPLDALGLDAEQRAEVRRILERRRPELDAVIEPVLPRLREVQDAVERDLRDVLTEPQRVRLDELRRGGAPPPLPR